MQLAIANTAERSLEERFVVFAPVATVSEANRSRHEKWFTKKKRVDDQHTIVRAKLNERSLSCPWRPPVVVKLTRFTSGIGLDDDNVRGALKHVRDAIARWIGVDDRHSELVTYEYAQAKCARGKFGVRIEIARRRVE